MKQLIGLSHDTSVRAAKVGWSLSRWCVFFGVWAVSAPIAASDFEAKIADEEMQSKRFSVQKGFWHLYLEANIQLPFETGARIALQVPGGLRFAASYGVVQRAYIHEINKQLMGMDTYGLQVGRMIDDFTQSFFVWRAQLEWRPSEKHGFYMGLSYVQLNLRGQVQAAAIADLSTGFQSPSEYLQATRYDVHARLSLATAEIGWEWLLFSIINVRLGVGVSKLIGHDIVISTHFQQEVPAEYKKIAQEKAGRAGEIVHLILQQYNIAPSLSLGVGVRFF